MCEQPDEYVCRNWIDLDGKIVALNHDGFLLVVHEVLKEADTCP